MITKDRKDREGKWGTKLSEDHQSTADMDELLLFLDCIYLSVTIVVCNRALRCRPGFLGNDYVDRLALNSQRFFCICLPNAGFKGI